MARSKTSQTVKCKYFVWNLYRRDQTFYADGRTNSPRLGRYSLESNNRTEALSTLDELDRTMAVNHGLAKRSILDVPATNAIPFEEGQTLYEQYLGRPEVAGGASPNTRKRYRAVLDKFIRFAREFGIDSWNQINDRVLNDYLKHLKNLKYADRTLNLEGTCIKQIIKWLISDGHLLEGQRLKTAFRKQSGTSTYCWSPEQVQAMLSHCETDSRLNWLGVIILTLARSGLRIGELLDLRWNEVNLRPGHETLHVVSESTGGDKQRLTKNREGRSVPIHPELLVALKRLRSMTSDHGPVFRGTEGGRLGADGVRKAFVKRVIIPLKDRFPSPSGVRGFEHGRLHSFRHYFVSQAANKGLPIKVVQQWIGHKDSDVIDLYYHLSDKESKNHMDLLRFADEFPAKCGQASIA